MDTLIVIRQNNYWGAGSSRSEAEANYRKASGRQATSQATVNEFSGTATDLERIEIDDLGTIRYPKTVQKK